MANRIRIVIPRVREQGWRRLFAGIVASRHAAWAAEVMGRFRPRGAARQWQPSELIYAGVERQQFFTQVMQVTRPVHQRIDVNVTFARPNQQAILARGPAAAKGVEKAERVLPIAAHDRTIAVRWPPVERFLTSSLPPLPVRSMQRTVSALPAESGGVLAGPFSLLRLQRVGEGMNREITELEVVPLEGDRITRRFRRVETLPPYQPVEMSGRTVNHRARPDLVFQSKVLSESVPSRNRTSKVEDSATDPPTSLNFGAITDEVMRQIDRRLVATRERMGKM